MDIYTLTSSIAGICMAICQVPQAWRVWKTGDTQSISLWMQIILTLGIVFWFVSGLILSTRDFWGGVPMWLSNGFCMVFCFYILGKKVHDTFFLS